MSTDFLIAKIDEMQGTEKAPREAYLNTMSATQRLRNEAGRDFRN